MNLLWDYSESKSARSDCFQSSASLLSPHFASFPLALSLWSPQNTWMQLRGFQCGQRLMVLTNFATLSLSFPLVLKSRSQPARFTFCHISSRCSKQIRPVYFCPLPPLEPGSWQRDGVCWWQQHTGLLFGQSFTHHTGCLPADVLAC